MLQSPKVAGGKFLQYFSYSMIGIYTQYVLQFLEEPPSSHEVYMGHGERLAEHHGTGGKTSLVYVQILAHHKGKQVHPNS